MPIRLRSFAGPEDLAAIGSFLARHYQPGNRDGNWFEPVWEYAYTHPCFDESAVGEIGLWEDGGEMVAVATYELCLGEAFFPHPPRLRPPQARNARLCRGAPQRTRRRRPARPQGLCQRL